jgi:hypothetical protein
MHGTFCFKWLLTNLNVGAEYGPDTNQ